MEQRPAAARHIRVAAGAALDRALAGPTIDLALAAVAFELVERADEADPIAVRHDRVRHGVGNACDDVETFALVAGQWERAEAIARGGLDHGCNYRDNHAIHVLVARAARGLDLDIELVDPDHDLRSGVLRKLLGRLPREVLHQLLGAAPPELGLEWLVATWRSDMLIDVPDRTHRVAAALASVMARFGDGILGRHERGPISELLFPDRGVRSYLRKASPDPDLARCWQLYAVLLSASTRLFDERYISEAIEAGGGPDWIATARRELDVDGVAADYRTFLDGVLPRIEGAGPRVAKSFRVAVQTLTDRGRQRLAEIAATVAPTLAPLCTTIPPDDPMTILLRGIRRPK